MSPRLPLHRPTVTAMVPTMLPSPLPLPHTPPTHPRMIPYYPGGIPQHLTAPTSVIRPPPHLAPSHPHSFRPTFPPSLPHALVQARSDLPHRAMCPRPLPSPPPLITHVWPYTHSTMSPTNQPGYTMTFLSTPMTKPSPPPLITTSPVTPPHLVSQPSNRSMVAMQQVTPNLHPSTITRVPVATCHPIIQPRPHQPRPLSCQLAVHPPALVSTPHLSTSLSPSMVSHNMTPVSHNMTPDITSTDTVSNIRSKMNQVSIIE